MAAALCCSKEEKREEVWSATPEDEKQRDESEGMNDVVTRPSSLIELDEDGVSLSHGDIDSIDLSRGDVRSVNGDNPHRMFVDGNDDVPVASSVEEFHPLRLRIDDNVLERSDGGRVAVVEPEAEKERRVSLRSRGGES